MKTGFVSDHVKQRMAERKISGQEVMDALRSPTRIDRVVGEPYKRVFRGKTGVSVVVAREHDYSILVTVFRRDRDDPHCKTKEASS